MSSHEDTTESWLGLVEFPGYDVSDRGRVRSYWKRLGYRYGFGLGDPPQYLKLINNPVGYLEVNLKHRSGKIRTRGVHLLVLQAFKGLKQPGQVCRHLNDRKHENTPDNLVWGTTAENNRDRFANGYKGVRGEDHGLTRWSKVIVEHIRELHERGISQGELVQRYGIPQTTVSRIIRRGVHTGRHVVGSDNPQAKLSEDQVREIRRLRNEGMKQQAIADRFGVARSLISVICSGKYWRHLI